MKKCMFLLAVSFVFGGVCGSLLAQESVEYLVLATNKTSTMEKEMGEAAQKGYRFSSTMGGETSFGGSEVVVVMEKASSSEESERFQYKLLATSKTSTMQKELQETADEGYEYRGQTVFSSTFGGKEVVIILEREPQNVPDVQWEYKLLATKKTSTMQKELEEAGEAGYSLVGLTVGSTLFGGSELVSILRKKLDE